MLVSFLLVNKTKEVMAMGNNTNIYNSYSYELFKYVLQSMPSLSQSIIRRYDMSGAVINGKACVILNGEPFEIETIIAVYGDMTLEELRVKLGW